MTLTAASCTVCHEVIYTEGMDGLDGAQIAVNWERHRGAHVDELEAMWELKEVEPDA